jgi:hypothetical protein
MSGLEKRAIRVRSLCVLSLWFGIAGSTVAGATVQGAIPSDRLTRLIEHTLQQPGRSDVPLTFIVEWDAPVDTMETVITSEGGKLRFQFGSRFEVRISANRIKGLLAHLPANSHYLGVFSDTDSDLRHEFAAGQNYDTVNLTAGHSVTLVLNWDDYPSTSRKGTYLTRPVPDDAPMATESHGKTRTIRSFIPCLSV